MAMDHIFENDPMYSRPFAKRVASSQNCREWMLTPNVGECHPNSLASGSLNIPLGPNQKCGRKKNFNVNMAHQPPSKGLPSGHPSDSVNASKRPVPLSSEKENPQPTHRSIQPAALLFPTAPPPRAGDPNCCSTIGGSAKQYSASSTSHRYAVAK